LKFKLYGKNAGAKKEISLGKTKLALHEDTPEEKPESPSLPSAAVGT
jgi:hypothetical protein